METVTLEELLEAFRENIEQEVESEGFGSWSINASGQNLLDHFADYDLQDLKDLRSELREGLSAEITIDLTEHLVDHLTESIRGKENYLDDLEDDEVEELNFD